MSDLDKEKYKQALGKAPVFTQNDSGSYINS